MATKKETPNHYGCMSDGGILKPKYFIKFYLDTAGRKYQMNHFLRINKDILEHCLIGFSYDIKSDILDKDEFVFSFLYFDKWIDSISKFSEYFTIKCDFKIWCEDEFVGEKGACKLTCGYA